MPKFMLSHKTQQGLPIRYDKIMHICIRQCIIEYSLQYGVTKAAMKYTKYQI
jgi:hypothetical protein